MLSWWNFFFCMESPVPRVFWQKAEEKIFLGWRFSNLAFLYKNLQCQRLLAGSKYFLYSRESLRNRNILNYNVLKLP